MRARFADQGVTSDTVVDWRLRAACDEVDPEIFFPATYTAQTTAEAKAICDGCPVPVECRRATDEIEVDTVRTMLFGVYSREDPGERWKRRQEAKRRALQGLPPLPVPVQAPLVAIVRPKPQPDPPLRAIRPTYDRPARVRGALNTGQVILATGLSIRQLRYWEQLRLVVPSIQPGGRSGRPRLYSQDDVRHLEQVREWVNRGERVSEFPGFDSLHQPPPVAVVRPYRPDTIDEGWGTGRREA